MNKPVRKTSGDNSRQANQSDQSDSGDNEVGKKRSFTSVLFSVIPEFSQTWLTSMVVHTVLILVLALLTLTQVKDETITLAVGEVSPTVETAIEIPLEFEALEEPVEEFSELTETVQEDLTDSALVSEVADTSSLVESEFGDFSDADFSEVIGGEGEGLEGTGTGEGKPQFFKPVGGGDLAKKIVYVVDNSNSMTGKSPEDNGYGRMETALVELAKSINSLEPSQEFYIIFYSDTAYGLFHPEPATDYIRATPKNKRRVHYWLETVQCCLRTDGAKAFQLARKLKPELIYLLGDGAFTDDAHLNVIKRPIKGAVIQALGMNLSGGSAGKFKAIAKAHGGEYRDVSITDDGRKILNRVGPRPKNNKKGPVWGIALPVKKGGKGKGKKK